jgi:hypothetical protein
MHIVFPFFVLKHLFKLNVQAGIETPYLNLRLWNTEFAI